MRVNGNQIKEKGLVKNLLEVIKKYSLDTLKDIGKITRKRAFFK
jgi:hypothetical protein